MTPAKPYTGRDRSLTKLDEISRTTPLLCVEDLFHEYSIGEIRLWLADLNEAALRQEGIYDNSETRNDLFCFTHTLIRGLEAMYVYTTIKNKP